MKKLFLSLFFAVMATTGLYAQQISVVSSGGATSLYGTLEEAIEGADPGSVIYLPGGTFPINVSITKKLTIIGIGHYAKSGSVDGFTTINGTLSFREGCDGSAVMGCYLTGNVNIGNNGTPANDVLIRCCNVKGITVSGSCKGIVINQNYIRSVSSFNGAGGEFTNNICSRIDNFKGGIIANNIISFQRTSSNSEYALHSVSSSYVANNIFCNSSSYGNIIYSGSDEPNTFSGNMIFSTAKSNELELDGTSFFIDNNLINLSGTDKNDVFENYKNGSISPVSDFHFKEAYKQYESQVGVYAGGVDFDKQLAPVPYIVAKQVDTETDASGKLNVKIRVKAGQ